MRKDGKRLKDIDPYVQIIPYIMDQRVDSLNMFNTELELEPIEEYIREKRRLGQRVSHLGLLIAAYVRMIGEYPHLNRFVVNKRIYARNHFCVSFVIIRKDPATGKLSDTVLKVFFDLTENVFEVCEKISKAIDENREAGFENSMDKLLKGIFRVPGLASFLVKLFKLADRWGLLPRSVIDASPFHTGLFITDLASLRTNYVYHHCYNFGTTSIFIAMGKSKTRVELKDGESVNKRLLPLGVVTDERIADGYYFSHCVKVVERYLKNPEVLEQKPEKIIRE